MEDSRRGGIEPRLLAPLLTQENQQKEEQAIDCLQYFSQWQNHGDWESQPKKENKPKVVKTPRLDVTRPTLRMKLEKALSRTPGPLLARQCNRTPLVLSTRLIENHEGNPPPSTHKSLSRAKIEKENIIAREIRNATKYRIKPHKNGQKRQVEIVGAVLRGRHGEGFNVDHLIKKLESCRKRSTQGEAEGRFPSLFIRTYDLRLL